MVAGIWLLLFSLVDLHFCPVCGSTVYWEGQGFPGYVAIGIGNLSEKSRRPGGSRQRWLSDRVTDISDRATDISDRATDLSVGQRVNAASIPNNLRRDNVVSDTDVIPREALFESEKYPVRS